MPTARYDWTPEKLHEAVRLKQGGLTWVALGKALGVSGNQVRMALRDHGLWPPSEGTVTPVAETADPAEPDTLETRTARARADMERQHEKQLYRQLLQEKARTETIVDVLTTVVQALPRAYNPLPRVILKEHQTPEESVLVISDTQIGQWTRAEETGGLGHYNLDVFGRRAERLRQSVLSISQLHQKQRPLPVLNIFFAGDIADGEGIFPNHLAHLDLDVAGQVMLAVDTFAPLLISLLDVYPTIRVLSVSGNHGRSGKSKKEPGLRFRSNWDYIIAQFLRARLHEYADRIQWTIPETWFAIQEIQGWRFLVHHYDVVRGWMGLPFYGLDRYDRNFSRLLHAHGQDYHYMVGGHFHTFADVETPVGEWIINGAWPGASYHSLRNMAVGSRPSQIMFGVHPKHGITWRYKIDLMGDAPRLLAPPAAQPLAE